MSVFFVFVDGLGLGSDGAENPMSEDVGRFFRKAAGDRAMTGSASPIAEQRHVFVPVDANLGIEGLPQSGTGQVSLFTGTNASVLIGRHFGPFPHSGTKTLLNEASIARQCSVRGLKFRFINAYPALFFELSAKRNRWSTTTLMCRQAGVPLNSVEEVLAGKAITAEITQEVWAEKLGIDVPPISPEAAAERFLHAGADHDVVLYEYYLTDKAGHAMDAAMAGVVIARLDSFLWAVHQGMGPSDLLVVCSDHGNVEDLSVKTHTRNPVPLIVLGSSASAFAGARSIVDVTPVVLSLV